MLILTPVSIRAIRGADTQKEFCRCLGCTIATLSRWENGVCWPSPAYADKLHTLARCRGIVGDAS